MKNNLDIKSPLAINEPVVILPAEEYKILLKEAGYSSTPALDKDIKAARKRFKENKGLKWADIRHEFI